MNSIELSYSIVIIISFVFSRCGYANCYVSRQQLVNTFLKHCASLVNINRNANTVPVASVECGNVRCRGDPRKLSHFFVM